MLKACTSTTGESLSTLAAFKWALSGVTTASSTGQDDFLNSLLVKATKIVERYVGYPLRHASYAETLPGFDSNVLMASRTPIQAVNQIWHLPEYSPVTTSSYYVNNPDAGLVHRDLGFYWTAGIGYDLDAHVIPNSELRVFQMDYDAGYVLIGSTTTFETVPEDLEEAVLDVATMLYRSVGQDVNVQSQRVGDLSITWDRGRGDLAFGMTQRSAALLQRWRRVV